MDCGNPFEKGFRVSAVSCQKIHNSYCKNEGFVVYYYVDYSVIYL